MVYIVKTLKKLSWTINKYEYKRQARYTSDVFFMTTVENDI